MFLGNEDATGLSFFLDCQAWNELYEARLCGLLFKSTLNTCPKVPVARACLQEACARQQGLGRENMLWVGLKGGKRDISPKWFVSLGKVMNGRDFWEAFQTDPNTYDLGKVFSIH